ncbi:hypothetical protein MSAN_02401600 [Mycena sanguinolenta]|uniref:Uncharacterized protein n=1 Tax=Mycena sanguinolenta TaxID=230812 RepID=A0A8H6X4J3_9AGAR|nr:hypothetical protein MSAN_02401600 [Mycena sanguinolenta]
MPLERGTNSSSATRFCDYSSTLPSSWALIAGASSQVWTDYANGALDVVVSDGGTNSVLSGDPPMSTGQSGSERVCSSSRTTTAHLNFDNTTVYMYSGTILHVY